MSEFSVWVSTAWGYRSCSAFSLLQVVVTKIDKCGHGALLTNIMNLQQVVKTQTTSCFPQPFLVRWEAHLLIQIIDLSPHSHDTTLHLNPRFILKSLSCWVGFVMSSSDHHIRLYRKNYLNVQTPKEALPPSSAALLSPSLRWTCLESSDSAKPGLRFVHLHLFTREGTDSHTNIVHFWFIVPTLSLSLPSAPCSFWGSTSWDVSSHM